MTTLMPGRFQFVYNIGNSDVRTYDVFPDGQIQERIAKTNDVSFITTQEAMMRLDTMISLAVKDRERFKRTSLYDKITKTKVDILMVIKRYMLENPIEEDDIRWS